MSINLNWKGTWNECQMFCIMLINFTINELLVIGIYAEGDTFLCVISSLVYVFTK